jgi:hypothetical protein
VTRERKKNLLDCNVIKLLNYWSKASEENRLRDSALGQPLKEGRGEVNIGGLFLKQLFEQDMDKFMVEGFGDSQEGLKALTGGADVDELNYQVLDASARILATHLGLGP